MRMITESTELQQQLASSTIEPSVSGELSCHVSSNIFALTIIFILFLNVTIMLHYY